MSTVSNNSRASADASRREFPNNLATTFLADRAEIILRSMQREIADKHGNQAAADRIAVPAAAPTGRTCRQTFLNRATQAFVALLALIFVKVGVAANAESPGVMSDRELREQRFMPLIDGTSLSAWSLEPWHERHWTLTDGVIHYDGKALHKQPDKKSLWTKQEYGNVKLYAEWRLPAKPRMKPQPIVLFNGDFLLNDAGQRITRPGLDAGDSGVLLRGTSKCQANIWSQELGSGEINGYRTDRKMPPDVRRACIPIKKADRPLGEWNVFLITMQGDRMTVDLNGEQVINAARLPDVPKTGPIGLQHHGDTVQFRRVWVKSLD